MPALKYLEARPGPDARHRGVLVLLHGFPLSSASWEGQLEMARRGWHVIAPDYTARGDSIDDFAGGVIDLLDSLHIKEAVFGGMSMGGYVVFGIVRNAARYVQGLVLADTKATADTPEAVEGRKRMFGILHGKGVAAVADEMMPKLLGAGTRQSKPAVAERVRSMAETNTEAMVAGALHALMTRPDSTPLLPTIHVPTLIVVGEEDAITPPAVAEEMQRAIAGSALVKIAASGHLSNLEQPHAFNDALANFLEHRV